MNRNRRHRPSQRPGTPRGRRGAPRGILPGLTGASPRTPAPRIRGGRRTPASYAASTPRGVANSREPEARPRHVHCACCHGCSCPQGPPGGHRTPEPAPQCTLLTRTSTPAARASCPAHGHTARRPVLPPVSRGGSGLCGALSRYLEDHCRPVRPTPAPRSHTNLQIRANPR